MLCFTKTIDEDKIRIPINAYLTMNIIDLLILTLLDKGIPNKIHHWKRTPGFPPERPEEMQAAFEEFKTEARQRKNEVKKRTAAPKEFTDWLLWQSNILKLPTPFGVMNLDKSIL